MNNNVVQWVERPAVGTPLYYSWLSCNVDDDDDDDGDEEEEEGTSPRTNRNRGDCGQTRAAPRIADSPEDDDGGRTNDLLQKFLITTINYPADDNNVDSGYWGHDKSLI